MLLKAQQPGVVSRSCFGTVAKQGVDPMPDCRALGSIYRYMRPACGVRILQECNV